MEEFKHTNRLIKETSPYLRQHAHNPVDWYPWCAEAFEKARQEGKPILLSIGYSACHWCHVMEHESFESETTARIMNENFVCIKVDREERPDLDQIYMNAVQMLTGSGGWPMTVFLTPDGIPFYGGTYFPPQDRYGMPGFPRLLEAIADLYRNRRDDIMKTADEVLARLHQMSDFRASNEMLDAAILDHAFEGMAQPFDRTYGGFGQAPKFPASMNLIFLLRTYQRTRRREALDMVEFTLEKMAAGGIYDQIGGGFHRYSVDERWLVPHFEKMLYDNALLSRVYLYAYQATHKPLYRRIAQETIDYVLREMTDPNGGFYSTQDADSEGHEGKFYVWTPEEIKATLGEQEGEIFCRYYGVTEQGNFEGRNILNVRRAAGAVAGESNITLEVLTEILNRGRCKLYGVRAQRVWPGRDDKVLTSWNGLMLRSLAEAARVLDRTDYRQAALRNAEFVLGTLRRDGHLLRTYKDGESKYAGYLEDYAYYIDGLVALYEATFDLRWLEEARALADIMIDEFWDNEDGGFYFTGRSNEQLITRVKDFYDHATPSGNSVAADVLLRLGLLFDNHDYQKKAVTILRIMHAGMTRVPTAFGQMLGVLDFYLSSPKEICIVGPKDGPDTKALLNVIYDRLLLNKVVLLKAPDESRTETLLPLARQRGLVEGRATGYVCMNYTCQQPVTTPEALAAQLEA
jgi:uncharacterized protein YyaL (SSP411 family)